MRGYEGDAEASQLISRRSGSHRRSGMDRWRWLLVHHRAPARTINRGGVKVSPSEADLAFMQHPAVREAATFAVPHPSLGEDVVTAIVLHEPGSTSVQALRAYALQHLLPFKVPSSVVLVDEIPRNSMGKVSRGALRDRLADDLRADYVAPRNDEEALVAAIFAELFDLPRVGAFDHYFRLGGDRCRRRRCWRGSRPVRRRDRDERAVRVADRGRVRRPPARRTGRAEAPYPPRIAVRGGQSPDRADHDRHPSRSRPGAAAIDRAWPCGPATAVLFVACHATRRRKPFRIAPFESWSLRLPARRRTPSHGSSRNSSQSIGIRAL